MTTMAMWLWTFSDMFEVASRLSPLIIRPNFLVAGPPTFQRRVPCVAPTSIRTSTFQQSTSHPEQASQSGQVAMHTPWVFGPFWWHMCRSAAIRQYHSSQSTLQGPGFHPPHASHQAQQPLSHTCSGTSTVNKFSHVVRPHMAILSVIHLSVRRRIRTRQTTANSNESIVRQGRW